MSWKRLFSRSLAAAPQRLHFAAHSHHLWPDASYDGQMAAWHDAAALADQKWDKIMGPIWAQAQVHIAEILQLPTPTSISFAPNTHDFIVRLISALPTRPARILASDGEFHSFRRQMARWVEAGDVLLETVAADQLISAAEQGDYDLIFTSHILFNSGKRVNDLDRLAALADPAGPWVVIDGYHGFMAVETDLSALADRIFYLGGGYKYAMAGEGVAFLHAPDGYGLRPAVTGWYAAFDDLALPPGAIGYAPDGRRFLGSTFEPSGLYRFNHVQDMLRREQLTVARISDHVAKLQAHFIAANPLPDFTLLNPLDGNAHARFLAFQGDRAAALQATLLDQQIVTDVRGDVLRIGFAIYHEPQDVERLLEVISQL